MAFLLTDGKSSQYNFNATLDKLRSFNVTIYGIGVGEVNKKELLLITGNDTRMMYAENFESLSTIEKVRDFWHKKKMLQGGGVTYAMLFVKIK